MLRTREAFHPTLDFTEISWRLPWFLLWIGCPRKWLVAVPRKPVFYQEGILFPRNSSPFWEINLFHFAEFRGIFRNFVYFHIRNFQFMDTLIINVRT
jgi:hypothetical protein